MGNKPRGRYARHLAASAFFGEPTSSEVQALDTFIISTWAVLRRAGGDIERLSLLVDVMFDQVIEQGAPWRPSFVTITHAVRRLLEQGRLPCESITDSCCES